MLFNIFKLLKSSCLVCSWIFELHIIQVFLIVDRSGDHLARICHRTQQFQSRERQHRGARRDDVYPGGDFPRLPILGLRAIAENALTLHIDGAKRNATLRMSLRWWPFG